MWDEGEGEEWRGMVNEMCLFIHLSVQSERPGRGEMPSKHRARGAHIKVSMIFIAFDGSGKKAWVGARPTAFMTLSPHSKDTRSRRDKHSDSRADQAKSWNSKLCSPCLAHNTQAKITMRSISAPHITTLGRSVSHWHVACYTTSTQTAPRRVTPKYPSHGRRDGWHAHETSSRR